MVPQSRDRVSGWFRGPKRKILVRGILFLMGGLEVVAWAAAPQWHQENGFRWAELNPPGGGRTGFKLLPPEETGIHFTNTLDLRAGEASSPMRIIFRATIRFRESWRAL